MTKPWIGILFVGVLAVVSWQWLALQPSEPANEPRLLSAPTRETATGSPAADAPSVPAVEVVAQNPTIPWEVLFLPDGELLVTERPGTVVLLRAGAELTVPGVRHVGEGGLLGAALHPEFADNRLLYLYQTTETDNGLRNRIVRYRLEEETLTFDRVIITDLPGARYHDGGRLTFGPDGYLYATVGDATDRAAAQDPTSLAGTIIRLTAEGEIPEDNPFGTAVWSYGHRNPQGLAWDAAGQLWSTEHGRSVGGSGLDEVNRIEAGANYGWPDSQGDTVEAGTIGPIRHSGAEVTWAPASAAVHNNSLYFAGLRGETLYEAVLEDGKIVDWHEHLVGRYGRLRTVTVGPDGFLYVTTSNRDGRGDTPAPTDDRLLRIDPVQLRQ